MNLKMPKNRLRYGLKYILILFLNFILFYSYVYSISDPVLGGVFDQVLYGQKVISYTYTLGTFLWLFLPLLLYTGINDYINAKINRNIDRFQLFLVNILTSTLGASLIAKTYVLLVSNSINKNLTEPFLYSLALILLFPVIFYLLVSNIKKRLIFQARILKILSYKTTFSLLALAALTILIFAVLGNLEFSFNNIYIKRDSIIRSPDSLFFSNLIVSISTYFLPFIPFLSRIDRSRSKYRLIFAICSFLVALLAFGFVGHKLILFINGAISIFLLSMKHDYRSMLNIDSQQHVMIPFRDPPKPSVFSLFDIIFISLALICTISIFSSYYYEPIRWMYSLVLRRALIVPAYLDLSYIDLNINGSLSSLSNAASIVSLILFKQEGWANTGLTGSSFVRGGLIRLFLDALSLCILSVSTILNTHTKLRTALALLNVFSIVLILTTTDFSYHMLGRKSIIFFVAQLFL